MVSYIKLVVRWRWLVLALVAALTLAAALIVARAHIASTIGGLFLGESPAYQAYVERARRFGNDELLLVAIEALDLGAPAARAQLAQAIAAIRHHPDVGRVTSLLDAGELSEEEGALVLRSFAGRAARAPDQGRALLQRACRDPRIGGLLLSRDCRHVAVIIELRRDEQRSAERYPQLVREVLQAFAAAGLEVERLHRSGWIAVLGEVMAETLFNLTRLLPLVGLVLLVAMLALFRQLWPVAVTGLVALIGVVWTLGFGVLLFERIDVFMALCPVFILIIACADVVHLCSAYQLELARGADQAHAVERAGAEVGEACLFTSLTTFAGFVSIALVPAPVFRQSGLILGFGVAISLLLALTLTPILLHLLPEPAPRRPRAGGRDLLDAGLARLGRLTRTHPWPVIAAFGALAALSALGLSRMQIETDFSRRLDPANPVRVDLRFFEQHFDGANSLDLFVVAEREGGLLDPALFARVAALQDAVAGLPGVDRVLSLVDLVREAHGVLGRSDAADAIAPGARAELPDTRAALAQYLLLLEMDEPARLGEMIDGARQTMRLHARLGDHGFLATHRVGEAAQAAADRILGDAAGVEVSGLTYLLGSWLDVLVDGQRRALAAALATIFVMMVLALRSLRAGLWSMIPNALPLLALLGWVGGVWDAVDSDTYLVTLIAIGVGVDDTIHFLLRYRRERQRSADVDAALDASFAYAGRAIVITSVILVAGFAPLALSDYFTTRIFGTLLPACLLVALAADLVLVPALIKVGLLRLGETGADAQTTTGRPTKPS